jgi:hypothetical protein
MDIHANSDDARTAPTFQPSAGDLLCAAVDRWAQHAPTCPLAECGECDAGFNQVRLAWKVWSASRYKTVAAQSINHELLAALKSLYRIGPRPWIRPPSVTWKQWDAAYQAADAAIARAEGK